MKKLLKFIFHRVVLLGLVIVIQLAALMVVILKFQEYFVYFYVLCFILSVVVVLNIINSRSNPAYKIAWIVPILLVPIFGGLFYLLFGSNKLSEHTQKKMDQITQKIQQQWNQHNTVLEELAQKDINATNQSRYIQNYAFYPPYRNNSATYFPLGEIKFEHLKEELKKAQRFIFMEYFILEEGIMWNTILDILCQKAAEGVDVRIIYDDFGCIMTLPYQYNRKLEQMGIQCEIFNPFIPIASSRLNNRDHRKIVVIDGHTAFTGGINLADEYINAYPKHGHWKDTAIMIKGEAVCSFTVMFLSMWDYLRNIDEDVDKFYPKDLPSQSTTYDGYIQPFTDSPLDHEPVGETVYLNLINKAKKYIYINTPYLIIDNEMVTALCIAAKAGIDVRIVTPHVADKWFVHAVTRAYYDNLIECGVKIYEYTPGFIHAKTFLVDDIYGVVGSINLDYRSLYLHFECGVWMYQTSCLQDMKHDYEKTLEVCEQITLETCRKTPFYRRMIGSILRVFAPLM